MSSPAVFPRSFVIGDNVRGEGGGNLVIRRFVEHSVGTRVFASVY